MQGTDAGPSCWSLFLFRYGILLKKIQGLPLGSQMINILVAGALVGCISVCMGRKKVIFAPSSLNLIAFILIFYMFISLILGDKYLTGSYAIDFSGDRLKDLKNFCIMPVLFFISLNCLTEKKWIHRTLIVMGLAIILTEYYTSNQIREYSSFESREKISGTFQFLGPNEVAAFLNEYTVILIGIFFFIKNIRVKWPLFMMICANIYCILFLFSRGAYLGLFAGLLVLFLFKNRKLLIPLIFIGLFWQTILPERVIERISQTKSETGELDTSAQRRINIWEESLEIFQKNFIVGIGLGVFGHLGMDLGDTHNIYVKYLVEQGLVGITIFLILIFCFLRMGYVLYKKGEDDLSKGMGLGLMACIIVLLVNNFFGNRWSYPEMSTFLWVYAGLVGRLIIMAKNPGPLAEAQQKEKSKSTPFAQKQKKKKPVITTFNPQKKQ